MKKWKLYLPFLPVVILAIAAVAGQTGIAWICALIVYTLARLAGV